MALSYAEALAFLYPRTQNYKFGLERTERLLDELGRPDRLFPIVHVGGTNGKGSVSTLIAETLRAAGWRTGLYTSPHLVSFRERYLVDRIPIGGSAVAMWVEQLRPLIERIDATFFEVGTALAFADFAARGAEIAVIEVGLGGRLDSTNVVRPIASVVTKIELDHQKYLGETLEEIATEKAGIAKPGAPFIVGETRPELIAVLRREGERAVRRLDPAASVDLRVVPPGARYEGELLLAGAHQRRNAAVAQAALEALPSRWRPTPAAIEAAFAAAFIPGRLDRRGRWLFDVAHNLDGVRALVKSLGEMNLARPITALVSILGDKAWADMLVELDNGIDRGILTIAPSADTRRWDIEWLRRWLKEPHRPPARAQWHLTPDFGEALAEAQRGSGTIVVTGSFHTVGDVMRTLGL
ncbi:MAG TPA: Mur ligase family protein [Gemmatimonadales bacterium]